MSNPFPNVLPVLRAPHVARRDPAVFHTEVPADRTGATPWAAFTCGRGLLSTAEVAASGMGGQALLQAAIAHLAQRPAEWKVEGKMGGFLGLGQKPGLLSYTDEFAAEQILVRDFLEKASRMLPAVPTFVIPRRGQIRAYTRNMANQGVMKDSPYVHAEMALAHQTYTTAGPEALCPAGLGTSNVRGTLFSVSSRFVPGQEPYVPPLERVQVLVLSTKAFKYTPGKPEKCPQRPLLEDLVVFLGVRDDNSSAFTLGAEALTELGITFENQVDQYIGRLPLLPVVEMGSTSAGTPVVGFRGLGAADQVVSPASLSRLHAYLGDPYQLIQYSPVRVGATTANFQLNARSLLELVEIVDPREPGVIMTRGTPNSYGSFTVSGGKLVGFTPVKA